MSGSELGYSQLLADIASTPAARRALLAGFFEPTSEDLETNSKSPSAAHKAIAALVARGIIRVIVTTNFDRLLEHALAAEGVMPQVISTNSDVLGMEPLQHARATIIKVNGDYASLDQRNTVEELDSYLPETTALLRRVFDEYGLVVSGWSADWDAALVSAVKSSANRRYPLYWTARSQVASGPAAELVARTGVHVIEDASAEVFFPDLVDRVKAVQGILEPPPSRAVKLARLRRALPDPVRHLDVRSIFEAELRTLKTWSQQRSESPPENTNNDNALDQLVQVHTQFETLIELFATGILLDRDHQHDDLWVWVLQQALNTRERMTGSFTDWWDNILHLPAFFMLRAGTMAALLAGHEQIIVRMAEEPTWNDPHRARGPIPAYEALHLHVTLDYEIMNAITPTGWSHNPTSRWVRTSLDPIAKILNGNGPVGLLLDRMEYRMALASQLLARDGDLFPYPPAGGELARDARGRSRAPSGHLAITDDFLKVGDRVAWGYRPEEASVFESEISELDDHLSRTYLGY